MPDIITIGEILVEIMAAEKGQPFSRPGLFRGPYPSGAPAIFIDQAARMGADCGIISRVGDDPFGKLNLARLRADGVDTSRVTADPQRLTGIAFVTYHPDGEREFLYHFREAAIGSITPEEIDEAYLAGAKYLHLMGCTLLASPAIAQAVLRGAKLAARHGVPISLDPNIRPELMRDRETRTILEEILRRACVVLTGAGELRQITGCPDLESGVEQLLQTAETVVVKNGSRDTWVCTREERFSVPVFPSEEVDPTGAGDCFDGAFLAALTQGCGLRRAARLASAAGALAVRKFGPMEGAATRAEIEALACEASD